MEHLENTNKDSNTLTASPVFDSLLVKYDASDS